MKTILSLGILSFLTMFSFAQETPSNAQKKAEEKPAYTISFVTVGARSDAYWIGDGPKMKVYAVDPGAAPPKDVYIAVPKGKGKGKSSKKKHQRLFLGLNVPTERLKVRNLQCALTTRYQSGDSYGYKNYTTLVLDGKPVGPYSVFLSRNPKRKTWQSPQRLILSDSLKKFPLGSARITNMSDRIVVIKVGDKIIGRLAPGKFTIIKNALKLKNAETVMVIYKDKRKKRMAFRRSLNYPKDQRVDVVCTYVPKRSKPILASLFTTKPVKKLPVVSSTGKK